MSRTELGGYILQYPMPLLLFLLCVRPLSTSLGSPVVFVWPPVSKRDLALDSSLASIFFQTSASHLVSSMFSILQTLFRDLLCCQFSLRGRISWLGTVIRRVGGGGGGGVRRVRTNPLWRSIMED